MYWCHRPSAEGEVLQPSAVGARELAGLRGPPAVSGVFQQLLPLVCSSWVLSLLFHLLFKSNFLAARSPPLFHIRFSQTPSVPGAGDPPSDPTGPACGVIYSFLSFSRGTDIPATAPGAGRAVCPRGCSQTPHRRRPQPHGPAWRLPLRAGHCRRSSAAILAPKSTIYIYIIYI